MGCEAFMNLPSKQEYPDYYKVIEKPIDIQIIQDRLNAEYYDNLSDFLRQFTLLCSNARQYNEPGSEIFTDANKIENILVMECKRMKIDPEIMIRANLIKPNKPMPGRGSKSEEQ